MSQSGSTRAIVAAFFANVGIAIAKFVGFLFTRSASMLAESIHSFADTGNQALLLLGGRRSRKPATEMHAFGYSRERYFWSFVVALVLFSLGGLFSIAEGTEKLLHPHHIEDAGWALAILAVSAVLEAGSLRTAASESAPLRGRKGWWAFIRGSRNPELPVVLLEDTGALIGLGLAMIAISVAIITGDPVWDGLGSIAIGTLLCAIAAVLAVEMKSLLIGESAVPDEEARIRSAIESNADVDTLIHLRTQHLGPEDLLVATKVAFRADLTVPELARAIDAVEADVRAELPTVRLMYVEPDLLREN